MALDEVLRNLYHAADWLYGPATCQGSKVKYLLTVWTYMSEVRGQADSGMRASRQGSEVKQTGVRGQVLTIKLVLSKFSHVRLQVSDIT